MRRLIYSFIDNERQENSLVQNIELFSNLIVSLFEQLGMQLKETDSLKESQSQLSQQIISLEEIIVNLEKQLISYESQYNQLEKLYEM